MKVLAMDTSTLAGSVALVDDDRVLAESVSHMRANHSEALMPLVHDVLTRAGVSLAEVDVLAVGMGPGSFTGVRIGLALAKGLRLGASKRLAGVTSLDAVAAAAVGVVGLLAVVLDARRDEVFVQVVAIDARGDRAMVLAPQCGSPASMGAAVRDAAGAGVHVTLTGDLDASMWNRFDAGCGGPVRRLPRMVGTPLARFVAAEVLAGRGVFDDDDRLEPIYLRASDAKLPGGGVP